MNSTIVVPVRMPVSLKTRIDALAHKGLITRNRWIVRTLTREAHLIPLDLQRGVPDGDENKERGEQERG